MKEYSCISFNCTQLAIQFCWGGFFCAKKKEIIMSKSINKNIATKGGIPNY